jgi:threonine/homoserine/homoserine lactone efflux protein
VMLVAPGPDMMLVMGRGVGQGRRVALLSVVGMTLVAGTVQLALLVMGVVALLHSAPGALTALQWSGAAYLVWLGWHLLVTSDTPYPVDCDGHTSSTWRIVREGAISNLTNPKSLTFMFAFLPQFVDPSAGPVWLQLLLLGSLQKVAGAASLGSVAMVSSSIGGLLRRWPVVGVWQQRFTGAVMVAVGARMFFADLSSMRPGVR